MTVERILPVRGLTHGLELVFRLAARDGLAVEGPDAEPFTRLRGLYRDPPQGADRGAVILRGLASAEVVAEMAERVAPALLVLDEGLVEFAETPSAAPLVEGHANLVVLRSLSMAYGLAGARIGAAIAQPQILARLAEVVEPYALPESAWRCRRSIPRG